MTETESQEVVAEATELEKKIARQIEYYFGDANLKRDRFLQLQIREDNGWVPLETMVKFNRLKILTTDFEAIIKALEKSPIGLMEVSEDKSKIRRVPSKPLPEETASYWKSVRERTVYCKGFAIDESLDTIQEFMEQFGVCVQIQMRKDKDKRFKGSIFATYESEEAARKFLESDVAKFKDTELIKKSKEEYFKLKTGERKTRRDDEKKKKLDEKEEQENKQLAAMQSEFDDYKKGCVLHFSGVNAQTSREDLKELFGEHGTIQWVDFVRGLTEGTIRFSEDTKAQDVLDKVKAATEGAIQIRGCELALRVLEGEEEDQHWKEVFENKSRARLKKMQGRRGRKQRGFNRRDRGDRGDRAHPPQNKKTKFDSDEDEEEEHDHKEDEEEEHDHDKKEEEEEENGNAEGVAESKGVKRPVEEDKEEEPVQKKEKPEES